jgi:hypothetical protein
MSDIYYLRMLKLQRYGSRRTKVFIRRARRAGWDAEGILYACKYRSYRSKLLGEW